MLPRAYRDVLAVPQVRAALLLALVTKAPPAGASVIVTLHVVKTLGYDYGRAGLVGAVMTLAIAVAAPWRGRMLDHAGLRRTIAPAILAQAVGWSIGPFVGYLPLLAISALTGLMVVPVWAVIRQSIMAATTPEVRKAALSLDSSLTELAFMVGPAAGAWLAITWDTRWALLTFQLAGVAGGVVLVVGRPAAAGWRGVERAACWLNRDLLRHRQGHRRRDVFGSGADARRGRQRDAIPAGLA